MYFFVRQYNVTQDEYDAAYAEYLRAVQEEEAQQQFLAEIRDREKYGDDYVDGSDELSAYTDEEDSYEEAGLSSDEPSPTLAEYKFFSNRVTRSTRGECFLIINSNSFFFNHKRLS